MSSARRVEDGVHGLVYERSFDTVRADDEVEQALDRATRAGALVEFKLDDKGLVTRRRWFEGTPLAHLFRDADPGERRSQSVTLFSRLGQELSRLEDVGVAHGAIHPSNVLIANGLQLVDAVANNTRLGVQGRGLAPGWLWSSARPVGVSWADWDRANLLRMTTLLGLPPEGLTMAEAPAAILAMCRKWAASAIESLPAGSHSERAIENALRAAERVAAAPPAAVVTLVKPASPPTTAAPAIPASPMAPSPAAVLPAAPTLPPPNPPVTVAAENEEEVVGEIAQSLFRAVGAGHMLRTRLEEQIIQVAAAQGVAADRARGILTHWLRRRNYVREADLLDDARRTLRSGMHHQVWVPVNVVMNAQRTFTQHDVGAQDAENLVASMLRELNLRDEREGEREWGARLDAYVGKNCPKKTFTSKQRAEMCALIASFGIPKDMSEQVTKRFLDRQGFTEKTGWW